jgi:hypothetical protein
MWILLIYNHCKIAHVLQLKTKTTHHIVDIFANRTEHMNFHEMHLITYKKGDKFREFNKNREIASEWPF